MKTRFCLPLPPGEREGAHNVGRVRAPATEPHPILGCTLTRLSADAYGIRLTPSVLAFSQRERRFAPPSPGTGEGIENEATP